MSEAHTLTLVGGRPLRGRLRVPGDKGISHRALVFAALADGPSRIVGLADGDDVTRTRGALEMLGVGIRPTDGGLTIAGAGPSGLREPETVLECGNSGTTMRILAGLLAGRPFHSVLAGDRSLAVRPMGRVVEPLRAMGAQLDGRDGGGRSPLAIRGGGLRGIEHDLEVASAQVKTALILAGLQAEGATVIREPHPSRDHTERLLRSLGAPIERVDSTTVTVEAGEPAPFDLEVPGDPSSCAFFTVAASIVPGSEIVLEGVSVNPTRLGFVDVLCRMGAEIEVTETELRLGEPVGDIRVAAAPLRGTVIEGREIPNVIDELPVLAVAAAVAEGPSEIRDASELRVKESDRIAAVEQELAQLGVEIEVRPDGFTITGGARLAGAVMKSHGDHRIAMSVAVAALVAEGESTIRGWQSVEVSYPAFMNDLERILPSA